MYFWPQGTDECNDSDIFERIPKLYSIFSHLLNCGRVYHCPRFLPLSLFTPFALCLFSFSPQRGRVYFPNLWPCVWPCDLPWPKEWDASKRVQVLYWGLKKTCVFSLALLWCDHFHEKNMAQAGPLVQEGWWETHRSANLQHVHKHVSYINAHKLDATKILWLFVTQQELTDTLIHHEAGVRKQVDMTVKEKPVFTIGWMWGEREMKWRGQMPSFLFSACCWV